MITFNRSRTIVSIAAGSLLLCFTVARAGADRVLFADSFEITAVSSWAYYETFDGDPPAPSQELLPGDIDFVVTHRTHPRDHLPQFPPYPADHGDNCAGPAPFEETGQPAPQHLVHTRHNSSGADPDPSFFVCKNHMMSSMGDVEGYSVTAFYPRQEFDFSAGGTLQFDVNINDGHSRSWWEILIAPRDQLKTGAARSWLPIDETYPRDRIVLEFSEQSARTISVGSGELAPAGWQIDQSDWRRWRDIYPGDPALDDRRQRRQMKIVLSTSSIRWGIAGEDGTLDWYEVALPRGLPFQRGLVLFKTHAYTPTKDDNLDLYTYHWDNIAFTGPVVGRYQVFETSELVYLQSNGNRSIGETAQVAIEIPAATMLSNPVLAGQIHSPLAGQVQLSLNGGPFVDVHPYDYPEGPGCLATGWSSFRLPLTSAQLQSGENTLTWRIGPRPACASGELEWVWDGFSVKSLEIQSDLP